MGFLSGFVLGSSGTIMFHVKQCFCIGKREYRFVSRETIVLIFNPGRNFLRSSKPRPDETPV
jgi:hypothetical protein